MIAADVEEAMRTALAQADGATWVICPATEPKCGAVWDYEAGGFADPGEAEAARYSIRADEIEEAGTVEKYQ